VASGTIRYRNGDLLQQRSSRWEDARDAISRLDGVTKVETNHITHMFYIEYDPEKTSFEQIRKVVRSHSK
jgi:hypothetical protein